MFSACRNAANLLGFLLCLLVMEWWVDARGGMHALSKRQRRIK